MVENIYKLKNKILKHVEDETENMSRIDVKEIGELVDMVKDLAEAEERCWEAAYYRSVTEAMEKSSGYTPIDYQGQGSARQGYGNQSMRQGYSSGSMGHNDIIEKLGEEYRGLSREEKTMMKNKVLTMLGSM